MTDAKYHHQIPRTYMKSWCFQNDSTWIYDKNNKKIKQSNINHVLGQNYFHSIKAGSIFQTPESLEFIFSPLAGFKVEYDGKLLTTLEEFNRYYFSFDKWVIFDSKGELISRKASNILQEEIRQKNFNQIEEDWSTQMENDWQQLISSIKTNIKNNNGHDTICIPTEEADRLMSFIVMYDWRSPAGNKYVKSYFDTFQEAVPDIMNFEIPPEDRAFSGEKTVRIQMEHTYYLKKYYEFLHEKGTMYNQYVQYRKHLTFAFVQTKNDEFITSDNLAFDFTRDDKLKEIVFPVEPKLLICLCKKDTEASTSCVLKTATPKGVDYYNKKIFDAGNIMLAKNENELKKYITS